MRNEVHRIYIKKKAPFEMRFSRNPRLVIAITLNTVSTLFIIGL